MAIGSFNQEFSPRTIDRNSLDENPLGNLEANPSFQKTSLDFSNFNGVASE
jgi:hypothetical protein